MKREDISGALAFLDDELIDETARVRAGKKWTAKKLWKWGALAACLCLVLGAAARWLPHGSGPVVPPGPVDPVTVPDGNGTPLATSETYATLDELLAYLSGHDDHGGRQDGGGDKSANGSGGGAVARGTTAAAYGGYAYHVAYIDGRYKVLVSALDGSGAQSSINFPAQQLFLWKDRLVLVREFAEGGEDEVGVIDADPEWSVLVGLYDLADPARPEAMEEYVLRGELTACWMDGGRFYLLTEDGVCACGWSRLEDTSGYVPQLTVGGEDVLWGDEDINILGEPVRVEYTAALALDAETGEVLDKQAFYGNIANVYRGPGWLALLVSAETEKYRYRPEVYTFDAAGTLTYTGKVSLAAVFGLEPAVERGRGGDGGGSIPDGTYVSVRSVSRAEGVYRLICSYIQQQDGRRQSHTFAGLAADMATGGYEYTMWDAAGVPGVVEAADLDWEADRAILCVTVLAPEEGTPVYESGSEDRFIFADFDGLDIRWYDSGLSGDSVAGVDMLYSYGRPFGNLDSLIPLGNGLYLRYNDGPKGLDLYDFSRNDGARLLYQSPGELAENQRFEFQWEVYDEDTFGIMRVTFGPDGSARGATFDWCVYRVDPVAEPYTLLAAYPLGESPYLSGESLGFATFSWEGRRWYATQDSAAPAEMAW